jgi:hypothetical protein
VLTAVAVAVKPALVAPAAIVTDAGTVTEELLLDRLTVVPLVAAEVSKTVHASVPVPVSEPLLQVSALRAGVVDPPPVPLRLITSCEPFVSSVLLTVTFPVAAPVAVGLNCTFSVAVLPGLSVIGALTPFTANAEPLLLIDVRITGMLPADFSTIACVAAVFTGTLPNVTAVALAVRVSVAGSSCRIHVRDAPPPLAVSVAVPELREPQSTEAGKTALAAPDGTVIEAGTETAALLLAKETDTPPPDAGPLSVTVQPTCS